MIPRYSLPQMTSLWTDEAKYHTWTSVEVLAAEGQALLGVVSESDLAAIRRGRAPAPGEVARLEAARDHEVLAFLAAFASTIPGDAGRWVHHGMTSYDLVDTALGYTLARACDLILAAVRRLRDALGRRALEQWDTVCVARTHGIHAEPTTFGLKLAVHAFAVQRCLGRLRAARTAVAVGTVSGAVGTYSQVDPRVEEYVCARLGLGVEPVPTQVVARDRHAELLGALAVLGAVVEHLALEMRLLQRTEICEVEEPRAAEYQGSSAMPHKRNPTLCERLCGIARLLRANASAGYEDVALWHERDLAHSAVERVVLPDSTTLAHYQATKAAEMVEGLQINPERMRENLDLTKGLIYSSAVLSDLVEDGMEREKAYRLIQGAAAESWENHEPLARTLLARGVEINTGKYRPELFLGARDHLRDRLVTMIQRSADNVEI